MPAGRPSWKCTTPRRRRSGPSSPRRRTPPLGGTVQSVDVPAGSAGTGHRNGCGSNHLFLTRYPTILLYGCQSLCRRIAGRPLGQLRRVKEYGRRGE